MPWRRMYSQACCCTAQQRVLSRSSYTSARGRCRPVPQAADPSRGVGSFFKGDKAAVHALTAEHVGTPWHAPSRKTARTSNRAAIYGKSGSIVIVGVARTQAWASPSSQALVPLRAAGLWGGIQKIALLPQHMLWYSWLPFAAAFNCPVRFISEWTTIALKFSALLPSGQRSLSAEPKKVNRA